MVGAEKNGPDPAAHVVDTVPLDFVVPGPDGSPVRLRLIVFTRPDGTVAGTKILYREPEQ